MNDITSPNWFILSLLSGFATFALIVVLIPLAKCVGLLDMPDAVRKRHSHPVPMVGGLAIYISVASTVLIADVPDGVLLLVLTTGILVFIGLLDDLRGLGVRTRLAIQMVCTLVVIAESGVSIRSVGLDEVDMYFNFASVGLLATVFSVVGLTNAFNMVDGIDGLALGHALIALLGIILAIYITRAETGEIAWLIILVMPMGVAFLVNISVTPVKRVFLGDAGSLMLGFLLAWILIFVTQEPLSMLHPVSALWFVAVPVYDTLIVIFRRLNERKSPFRPDRKHLHHLLRQLKQNFHQLLS